MTGGGYLGNVTLGVDSTVARTTASQSFTGNQAINGGNLTLNIVNSSGGGLFVYGGGRVQNNYGGTPFYIVCTAGLQGTCLYTTQTGDLVASGALYASAKPFRIDHPLDPANKYLHHIAVESPEMKTFYDGVVEIGADGSAWVDLPDYFEALNRDFRYQLSAIGTPAPNLYIAAEISKNRFQIAGGSPGGKVSWQVTGIRQDAYAKAYPIPVEEKKAEPGTYIHPELFGQSTVPTTGQGGGK